MIRDLMIMGIIIMVCLLINHIRKYKELKFDNMILKKQVEEIRNNFKMYRNISDCESGEIERLKSRNAELLMENMQIKSLIGAYRNACGNGYQRVPQIPKDTVDAVRYAMKHTHPDNGGNAEDFIRFQKCYEELTRK
ncbi:MAG: hypothetical protein HFH72_09250 [Lachnospiraceae bacterium]|nr:hypothetical protein [Lachnospiraceae bacterium]